MSISHWGLFPIVQSPYSGSTQVLDWHDWIDAWDRHDEWQRVAYARPNGDRP